MKILLFAYDEDDSVQAVESLHGHDLTVFLDYDNGFEKGMDALGMAFSRPINSELSEEHALDVAEAASIWSKLNDAVVARDSSIPFEATLVAMGGSYPQWGIFIGLLSLLRGIPFVGMVAEPKTDSSSRDEEWRTLVHGLPLFIAHRSRCLVMVSPPLEYVVTDEACKRCKATGVCYSCKGSGRGYHGEWGRWMECCCRGSGKCDLCHGTARYIEKEIRKDWGRILRTLTA